MKIKKDDFQFALEWLKRKMSKKRLDEIIRNEMRRIWQYPELPIGIYYSEHGLQIWQSDNPDYVLVWFPREWLPNFFHRKETMEDQ
jgi:hypothetical protein